MFLIWLMSSLLATVTGIHPTPPFLRLTGPGRSPLSRSLQTVCAAAGHRDPTDPARSVHRLRPGDVSVVAALGDSVTAGQGARYKLLSLLTSERGRSWSGGGELGALTMPNILRQFTPRLTGAATGPGDKDSPVAGFNLAESGARSAALAAQARELVRQLRHHPRVNFHRDWKLVTILIGGNDICQGCAAGDAPEVGGKQHAAFVREALDVLHAELPRTFVNLVPVLDMASVGDMQEDPGCRLTSRLLDRLSALLHGRGPCPCLAGAERLSHGQLRRIVDDYQRGVIKLVARGRYDTRDDFTVVVQPFTLEGKAPTSPRNRRRVDVRFAAADCFHPSAWGQGLLAVMLWNNMMSPVDAKSRDGSDVWDGIKCPDPRKPFLGTYKNLVRY